MVAEFKVIWSIVENNCMFLKKKKRDMYTKFNINGSFKDFAGDIKKISR